MYVLTICNQAICTALLEISLFTTFEIMYSVWLARFHAEDMRSMISSVFTVIVIGPDGRCDVASRKLAVG